MTSNRMEPNLTRAPAIACAALAFALSGCAMPMLRHQAGPAAVTAATPSHPGGFAGKVFDLREQAARTPGEPYWPYQLGELYAGVDSTALAEAALQNALARDTAYAPAVALLSKLWYRQGRHDDAIRMLEGARTKLSAVEGGMPPALAADLALHYEAIGRHDLAQNLAAGLTDDDGREAGSVRVFITLRGDAPDSATDLARSVAHAQDKSAPSQNNFGITRLRAGDPEGARKAFLNAIALDPALPGPYYNLAILEKFYMLDDDAAAGWFKLYRQRASDDPDGLAQVFETNTTKPIAADKGDAR